jgi:hypothetical protein
MNLSEKTTTGENKFLHKDLGFQLTLVEGKAKRPG